MTSISVDRLEADRRAWAIRAARAGWVARAVIFVLVGVLAGQVGLGQRSEEASARGALEEIARQPLGQIQLLVMAAGLVAFAAGRVAEATVFSDRDQSWWHRLGRLASATAYAGLAVLAGASALGAAGGSAGSTRGFTARVMGVPGGRILVGAVGVVTIVIAAVFAWRAIQGRPMEDLDRSSMPEGAERVATMLGTVGEAGRAVAYAAVGVFVIVAAVQFDPADATGLDAALSSLAATTWGSPLIVAVGAAFVAYGLFCLVQARYRRYDD